MRRFAIPSVLIVFFVAVACFAVVSRRHGKPIKVGILHSQTGTMAISELPIIDVYKLAAEEINAAGGILGRPVELHIRDGASDLDRFRSEAISLIDDAKVCTIFGCWTSASHRTVKAVVKEKNHLLFYPVEYEGLVDKDNVVHTGAVPNQQIIPAVTWLYTTLNKRRFFLVGSDYVFPRGANAIARFQIHALGATVVGEEYVLLNGDQRERVRGIVSLVKKSKPDVILNTINGDKNVDFFRELRAAGITPDKIPTMSSSIAEHELLSMDAKAMAGDYATWNYFQSLDNEQNRRFVSAFKKRFGTDRVTDDPIEAGYLGFHLWKQAVEDAGVDHAPSILKAIERQSMHAPEGVVYIDPNNLHTWKIVRIGQIEPTGQFLIRWDSEKPIRPAPYPIYQSEDQWKQFRDGLYRGWGNRWANEATSSP